MNDEKLRGILELWIEYLRRSDKYKAYCEQVRHRQACKDNHPGMFINYSLFGDVYSRPLEDILSSANDWNAFFTPIYDYGELISDDIDACIDHIKGKYNRQPTAEEIKAFLVDRLSDPSALYLRIDLNDADGEGIIANFSRRLMITHKDIFQQGKQRKPFLHPSTRIRAEELRRYLRIYDYNRQGISMKDIIKKDAPSKDTSDIHVQRAYYRDLENAEKIIRNVEKGIFPGDYSK